MFVRSAIPLFAALALAVAQQSSVPSDLSSGFDPEDITLQVLYSDAAKTNLHGVQDGGQISQQEASQTPSFALGDASAVNPNLVTMIMLVDTTSSGNRPLHFFQTDFSANEDATSISTNTAPLVPYAPPGTLGESSGTRKYSWLMFLQPNGFKPSETLGAGDFNVQTFIKDNKLQPALAGIEMTVSISSDLTSNGAPAASLTSSSSSSSTSTTISTTTSTSSSSSTSTIAPSTSSATAAATTTTKQQTSTTSQSSAKQTSSSQAAAQSSSVPFISIAAATQASTSSISQSTSSALTTSSAVATTSSSSAGVITSSLPNVTLTTFVNPSSTSVTPGSKISAGAGSSVAKTKVGVAIWGAVLGVAALV